MLLLGRLAVGLLLLATLLVAGAAAAPPELPRRSRKTRLVRPALRQTRKAVDMNSTYRSVVLRTVARVSACVAVALTFTWSGPSSAIVMAQDPQFTTEFRLKDCGLTTTGVNPYFILKPGYRLVLEGTEDGETTRVEITVLRKTETLVVPGLGAVKARVVEERESVDGELVEVSRNFFAICPKTNDVFYFGEAVDIFNPDGSVSHEGSWRAGEPDADGLAKPGMIMPGTFLLGSRYFQELADGVALDRAEHVEMGLEVTTPAGTFAKCVRVVETSPLEPGAETVKVYCPGVGLVMDNAVTLVEFGSARDDDDDDEGNGRRR
jgi:hypothetical protein